MLVTVEIQIFRRNAGISIGSSIQTSRKFLLIALFPSQHHHIFQVLEKRLEHQTFPNTFPQIIFYFLLNGFFLPVASKMNLNSFTSPPLRRSQRLAAMAQALRSRSAPSSPSFTNFSKLPPELRLIIWGLSLPGKA
jgi:hypothetical protein